MIEVRFNAYRANEFLAALNTGRPLATNYPTWQPEDIFTLLGVLFTGISSGKWRDPERHNLAHPEVREHMDEIALGECVQAIQHLVDCMSMMMDNTYFDHYEVNHGLEISLDADGEPRFRPTFGVLNMPEGLPAPGIARIRKCLTRQEIAGSMGASLQKSEASEVLKHS